MAGAQAGFVTRRQLLRLGCSRRVVARWISVGFLIPVHRGVYAVGHLPRTHSGRWWAAVLACGEGAVASHITAAAAMGLLLPGARVHVTTSVGRSHRGIATHRGRVTAVHADGLPCTTPARTLIDLAGSVSHGLLESAVRQAQVRGVLDLDDLRAALRDSPRPRGIRRLRVILDDPVALQPTRSQHERVALRALLDAGWPRPLVNGFVRGTNERVDLHWPDMRLVLEVDGPTHEVSGVQRARDRRRDALLRERGWQVVRVPADRASDAPAAVSAAIATR